MASSSNPSAGARPQGELKDAAGSGDAPLFFRIGRAQFTPGGYVDLIGTFRSSNIGSGLTTNLTSIPFNNTLPAGRLSEYRFNPTGSRISLKIDVPISQSTAVTGYIETDFAGYQPANTDTTTNPSSLRLRHFWAQVRHGKWELLAGQSWSLECLVRHCFGKATQGSPRHLELLLAYVEGRPKQGVELSRPDGSAMKYQNMSDEQLNHRLNELLEKWKANQ